MQDQIKTEEVCSSQNQNAQMNPADPASIPDSKPENPYLDRLSLRVVKMQVAARKIRQSKKIFHDDLLDLTFEMGWVLKRNPHLFEVLKNSATWNQLGIKRPNHEGRQSPFVTVARYICGHPTTEFNAVQVGSTLDMLARKGVLPSQLRVALGNLSDQYSRLHLAVLAKSYRELRAREKDKRLKS